MVTSLADESRLLAELRGLAEQGRHREVLDRLQTEPAAVLEHRTSFALLAAEAHGRLGAYDEARRWTELALAAAHMRGEPQAGRPARNLEGAIGPVRRG